MSRLSAALRILAVLTLTLATAGAAAAQQRSQPRVLVFSKTAGFRHTSIETGVALVKKIGAEQGFVVDATEDATVFNDANLRRYRAIVFMSTTGDILDAVQQDALERYVQAGGGWVGVHSATDTEYEWPWYGKLAGAYFTSHPNNPNVRKATFRVLDKKHVSTTGFPDTWERSDEFYNFKSMNPAVHVLIDIDEKSYQGGTNGDHHPMSWYHEYDGGRAWYTNMGHTEATYAEPLFIKHLTGGIKWAIGTRPLDYTRAKPEENRFTKVILAESLDEPVELAVLPGERILFVERKGAIKLYNPATKIVSQIGKLAVVMKYGDGGTAEDGLLGLAADPNFARNGFVYMYYSPAGPEAKNVLSRFHMQGDSIHLASEKVMLEIPVQRAVCCHTGGSMTFDAKGNLFLSTGDNTNPFATGYAPIDERPDRAPWDAQKSSGNTNDLRGKILRIHPEPDGSYTIPEGNLFPKGTAKTRPEIYTMGHRNPYRISVDRHTGFLYWGDVGPDASVDSAQRGPMGHDELNQARRAGYFGWPYFVGDNKAYYDYDFATNTPGKLFDPAHPVNESPNNTGLVDLPPAQKAFVWYPAGASKEFPLVGSGGRTAMAGPVFYRDDFRRAPRPFPQYYDGKMLEYEWMRGWIMALTMDKNGDLVSMERFMPSQKFSNPIELEFSPTGDLYMLEYGTGWFQANPDARLVRIEYNGGNRKPIIMADVDVPAGPLPLTVALSSQGTSDPDADALRYQWTITGPMGTPPVKLAGANPTYTFTKPGVYTATLAVTDAKGARSTSDLQIAAGNAPPQVDVEIAGNQSFYFPGTPIRYASRVTDREDGSLESGRIAADRVFVSAEYLKDGLPDAPPVAAGHRAGAVDIHAEAKKLISSGDCLACHQFDRKSIGPAYTAVADKYRGDVDAMTKLVKKVRTGGSGVWGNVTMPAHPQLTEAQASRIVSYVLSLGSKRATPSLPVRGEYVPATAATATTPDVGAVVLRAEYTDQGANGLPGAVTEKTLVLRPSTVVLATGELSEGVSKMQVPQMPVPITMPAKSGSFVRLKQLDLTGIAEIVVSATAPAQYGNGGGKIEIHLDSATGALVGETETIAPSAAQNAPPVQMRAALKPTSGVHDVYVVFRNEQLKAQQMMMVALTATFVPVGAPQAQQPVQPVPYFVGNRLGLPMIPAANAVFDAISPNVKVFGAIYSAESCSYDADRGVIVVPNRGVPQNVQGNNAWISFINHDGSVHTARWIGVQNPQDRPNLTPALVLNEPYGSDIANGILYVADRDGATTPNDPSIAVIRKFNMKTGVPAGEIRVDKVAWFNDIEVADDGTIYATVTGDGGAQPNPATWQVWKITANGAASIFIQGAPLQRPNGIAFDPQGNIVVVNIGDNAVLTFSSSGQLLKTENAVQAGNDGLVIMPDGTKYVSSVINGGVSRIRPGQPAELIARNIPSAASMCYDSGANQLVIPMNPNNGLAFIPLR